MNRKRNLVLLKGFLDVDFKNVLSWLPLELFVKIVEEADERTTLEKLVERFPNKPWSWHWMSLNPAITPKFIEAHLRKKWDWKFLCINSSLTEEFVEKYKASSAFQDNSFECWSNLSTNPSISLEFFAKHTHYKWQFYRMSQIGKVTLDFLLKYKDDPPFSGSTFIKWNWGTFGLSSNPYVTPKIVKAFPDKPWHWGAGALSENPSITPGFILENLDKPWDKFALSRNPAIKPEFVEYTLEYPYYFEWIWGVGGLSENPSITPEFIKAHINKNWNWGENGLSNNSAVTPEFIEEFIEKPWGWSGKKGVASNPSLTLEFIKRQLHKFWGHAWIELSRNPAITPKVIEELDSSQCNWIWSEYGLSSNPSITFEFVKKNIAKPWFWGKDGLSSNSFGK
jgi:hypothetical protein